jgi:hypothetical protein
MNNKREFLRHCLATLAYRGAKVLRNTPPNFAEFKASPTTRTPAQILAHLGDLLDWAWYLAKGEKGGQNTEPLAWDEGVNRFFQMLKRLDDYLASGAPLACTEERLFQAPVADSLTHIGQIAMLRRMAGGAVRGENYFKAEIETGIVGPDQKPAVAEFD